MTTTTTTIFPIRVLSNWDTLFEVHPTCEYDNLGPIYALSTWHRIRSILDPSFLPPSPSPSSLVPPYPSPISPDSIPHTLNFYYSLMGKAPLPSLDLILDSNPSPLSSLVFTDVLTSAPFIRKIKGSDDCLFVSDTSYLPLSPDVNYYSYLGPDALSLIQHDLALLNS